MKKIILPILIALFGLSFATTFIDNKNTSITSAKAEEETSFCDLQYLYYVGNYLPAEYCGFKSFQSSDELLEFYNSIVPTCHDEQFSWFYVTLKKPGDVVYPKSEQFKVFANNNEFHLTNSYGQRITDLSLSDSTRIVCVSDTTLDSSYTFTVNQKCYLSLENCTMDGGNKALSKSLFNVQVGGCVKLNNTKIKNYRTSDSARLITSRDLTSDNRYYQYQFEGVGDSGFENITSTSGSPVYADYGTMIRGLSFTTFTAQGNGGAMNVGFAYVEYCNFTNCKSVNGYGGAIYINNYSSINHSSFTNCECKEDGGAIYAKGNNVSIWDDTFTSNTSGVDGGAICVKGDDVAISSCTFNSNHAKDDGGAIYVCVGTDDTKIENCSFTSNYADDSCDNIDGRSDTVVDGARYGSTISEGSIFIIVESLTVLAAIAAILIILKKRPKVAKTNE